MKKMFFALFAVLAMASCSNEEVIELNREQIAFGEVFVDNATRADYSSELIQQFNVYGTVTGTVTGHQNPVALFGGNGAIVKRNNKAYGVAWDCDETEHWIPGADYQFEAVVDGTIADGKIAYTIDANPDSDGVNDLLYAKEVVNDATATQGLVEFNFTHLLSKVGFSFTNGVTDNTAYTFVVTDVSFKGHDTEGTYTISTSKWDDVITASSAALSFGAAGAVVNATKVYASETHQIIPGNQTLAIAITYDIIYNGNMMSEGVTTTKNLTHPFEQNKVYNIAVKLPAPGNPIQFSVDETNGVGGWLDGGEAEVQ